MLIRTEEQAVEFLKSVHHFHDGFIQRIGLDCHDVFVIEGSELQDVSHLCTGKFHAVIDLAHDPTIAGLPPTAKVTRCVFKNVSDFYLDLRNIQECDWAILEVCIQRSASSNRLELYCSWNRVADHEQWTRCTQRLFSFDEMTAVQL